MTGAKVKAIEKRNILVGVPFDYIKNELLNWALIKVANPGDTIVAVHVCRNSDSFSKDKQLLDGYLEDYKVLCDKNQVELTGFVSRGSSIRKVLVREAKNCAAVVVIVGISKHNTLRCWTSIAKYCAKKLPPTSEVLAIDNGKVVFRKCSNAQKPGLKEDSTPKDNRSEFGESEISETHSGDSKEENFGPLIRQRREKSLSSVPSFTQDIVLQRPGWPLLRTANSVTPPPVLEARKMTVVQWVMSLPNRSVPDTPRSNFSAGSNITESDLERLGINFANERPKDCIEEVFEHLELILKTSSSGCKWFSYDVLNTSTSQFSSENLIGKGGSNRVYKGLLPDGKAVAVKILKSSKEAWKDFALEVDIMTTLGHKNITSLLGICVEDNHLISVYDYMPRGNLEENLHSEYKDQTLLSLEMRFNVAVGIAEALNYLHNECSQPVIHRDVKSSNILLSNEYQPQLSDFGLALWGPTALSFLTHSDVLGTFGYLAPEYFMYGKVSEKMDVYSFGVVLLELLSDKKPIGFETPKGQESLVMWAKPKLESGDLNSILDPNLDKNINKDKIQRMALAAVLCLTRAARLRPKMSQIMQILKGEKQVEEFEDENESENQEIIDDEVYPYSSAESHLSLALLDIDDDSTSFSSVGQSSSFSQEEYLKGRWCRSLSLD
ncbi:hypothetical protein LguiB_007334 [Lonicera macranthoides]